VSHVQLPQVSFHLLESPPEKPALNGKRQSAHIADAAKISVGASRRKSLKVFRNETIPVLFLRLRGFRRADEHSVNSGIQGISNAGKEFVSQKVAPEPEVQVR
jgi:hypothetical protein